MKTRIGSFLFMLLLLLNLASCAKRGTPEGGPEDTEPPKVVRTSPKNFSTNFKAKEIKIYFDEYVKLKEAQRQIIFSPPMDPSPSITPMGAASKSIKIEITDTLQPNTTYTINFGRSIEDNNAGNPLEFFQYVFSTGTYLDSLSVSGSVSDAYLKEAESFISVMLYEVDSTYTDSIVYKKQPRYITNTLDSTTTFELKNLKEGTYKMIALQDKNNNYHFEPKTEKIGFVKDFIQIPTDSVYSLHLFKELGSFHIEPRPKQVAQNHLIFGFTGKSEPDSLDIKILTPVAAEVESRITRDREKDTLHYWYKPQMEIDSLRFLVQTPIQKDTLLARLGKADSTSLAIKFESSGSIDFNNEIRILPSTPIENIDESLISFIDRDTLPVAFKAEYRPFKNEILLDFKKDEKQKYYFEALPGAFTDFFGNQNDSIQQTFQTREYSDYGNVKVNLQNVQEFPIIVQLTNKKSEIQAEQYSETESNFEFIHLKPGEYYIRVIFDKNSNGIWDTGDFLSNRQPEQIVYFPDALDVRANWDLSQTFILK